MFFAEYLKNPKTIGALAPSSRFLARKMVKSIDFKNCKCIVEYGPGTGIFTKEIINRKRKETILIAIEQNENFAASLQIQYKNSPNVYVIHGDAGDVQKYLELYGVKRADYIVSGLPFTSLPKEVSKKIFHATKKAIGHTGKFITFQYTLIKKKFFMGWFQLDKTTFTALNFPPAFVLEMRNR